MVYKITQKQNAAALFEGWQESMIWSCMQGVMGELYTDAPMHPKSAMVWLGDFCLFAGEANQELARFRLSHPKRPFMIILIDFFLYVNVKRISIFFFTYLFFYSTMRLN